MALGLDNDRNFSRGREKNLTTVSTPRSQKQQGQPQGRVSSVSPVLAGADASQDFELKATADSGSGGKDRMDY